MSFTSFRSTRKVVVVDRFGRPTGEERILSNSPIDALFPDEKIVMVNWKYEGAKAPTAEELRRPIRHGGNEYRGDWAWGSSVKRGYTVGLTRDLLVDTGLLNCCEDAHRFGRAFLANGLYGAGKGELHIKFVPEGTQTLAGPVADGFGYVRRSVAEKMNAGHDKIKFGTARDSSHWWQRIPWTSEIQEELEPLLEAPLGTLKSRLHRARQRLRAHLGMEPFSAVERVKP